MEYDIIGIKEYEGCFHGFYLRGILGDVCPFVDGELKVDGLTDNKDASSTDFLLWARSQIGKKLICHDLTYKAFATEGKVVILTKEQ